MDEATAGSFTEFPLLWPGTSVAGYNLQAIIRDKYDAPADTKLARPGNKVTFIYGRCTPVSGQSGCMAPIGVHVQPACLVKPENVAAEVKAGPTETVRGGALQQRFRDGHLLIWTGDVSISIHASAEYSRATEVLNQLRGLGQAGTRFPQAGALPPPNLAQC